MQMPFFDPTDILVVREGQSLLQALKAAGFQPLIDNDALMDAFLSFNKIEFTNLNLKHSKTAEFFIHHPAAYRDPSHILSLPYNTRSLSFVDFSTRSFERSLTGYLSELAQRAVPVRILDLGMGQGRLALEMASYGTNIEVLGLHNEDWTPQLIETAKFFGLPYDSTRTQSLRCDLNEGILPFQDEVFDLIHSKACMRYLKRKDRLMEDCYRRLAPGGCVYMDVYNMRVSNQVGEEISLEDFFTPLKNAGVASFDAKTSFLYLKKQEGFDLQLNLEFDETASRHIPWNEEEMNTGTVGWFSCFKLSSAWS